MTCKLCLQRGAEFQWRFGNWPSCGFNERGALNLTDEWNCQTLVELRKLAREHGVYLRNDDVGTIFVLPFTDIDLPGEEISRRGWLIMECYKNRGHTDFAQVLCGSTLTFEPLNLELAEAILARYAVWKWEILGKPEKWEILCKPE